MKKKLGDNPKLIAILLRECEYEAIVNYAIKNDVTISSALRINLDLGLMQTNFFPVNCDYEKH